MLVAGGLAILMAITFDLLLVVEGRLVSFNVSAVTGGTDALGDVVVQLDALGRRVTGRGVATDVVEASARAYLAAVNRAMLMANLEAEAEKVTP